MQGILSFFEKTYPIRLRFYYQRVHKRKRLDMNRLLFIVWSSLTITMCVSCGKDDPGTTSKYRVDYGDSVLYVRNSGSDITYAPINAPSGGEFTGFPEGIEIDKNTGVINVSKSETGLRYRITYTDPGGDTSQAIVLISGINYLDHIYSLDANDTLALPLYNASLSRAIPANSIFDEGNGCNGVGIAVNTLSATINLAETIRNGTFGSTPSNGAQKEVELKYRINDGSNKTLNALKVKLYYFNTSADISPDLKQLLIDRQGTLLLPNNGFQTFTEVISGTAGGASVKGVAKPRPPCIFIVGRL